jgi:hypothetical protein
VKQGGLGTCAVVATGDNLLQAPLRGGEIDAHDTVIRYNSPMKGFEHQVLVKCPTRIPCDFCEKLIYHPKAHLPLFNDMSYMGHMGAYGSCPSPVSKGGVYEHFTCC